MVLYYFTDVSKSESEPFHVVYVSCRHAEEAVEYFLEVFFLDPDAVVLDRYQQLAVLVPGAAHQRQRHFEAAILHGVVQQVEQYVRDASHPRRCPNLPPAGRCRSCRHTSRLSGRMYWQRLPANRSHPPPSA